MILMMADASRLDSVRGDLAARRDRDGDSVSRLFLLPVERQR